MLKLAVISDLHLGFSWGTERGQDAFEQASQAFELAIKQEGYKAQHKFRWDIMPLRKILMYFEKHSADEGLNEEEEGAFHECTSLHDFHCLVFGSLKETTL